MERRATMYAILSFELPLDYSCDKMAEQARLQTWTMKPAWLKPPQGPVFEGERILL